MIKDKNIFIKNVYYMLSYAFTSLNQSYYDDIAKEEFDNICNIFAAILSKGIARQLKQGLYREYLDKNEDLPTLRGKIHISGTLRNKMERKQLLSCEFEDLSENNLLNQILKTTVELLLHHEDVGSEYKGALKKEMLFFSDVDTVDPLSIKWATIVFQRNNQAYRMLISVCQLVLEGMLLTTDKGEYRLAKFVDDQRMCRLFEKFILEYYIKEHPLIHATPSQIPWALDDGVGTMLPVMQTDIMLSHKDRVLIIDAKYYSHTTIGQYDVLKLHSNNLYQIFAYVKNKDEEQSPSRSAVSGMILYARTDDAVQPDNIYQMSGNQISVKTLDLNCEFALISEQLDRIVNDHF